MFVYESIYPVEIVQYTTVVCPNRLERLYMIEEKSTERDQRRVTMGLRLFTTPIPQNLTRHTSIKIMLKGYCWCPGASKHLHMYRTLWQRSGPHETYEARARRRALPFLLLSKSSGSIAPAPCISADHSPVVLAVTGFEPPRIH